MKAGLTLADLDIIEQLAVNEARESFWAFRQYINPRMKKGWWQRIIARHLQQFFEDLVGGKRPMLAIEAPPQHGKSHQIVDFIAWLAGKFPDIKTIYTSFSDRLGVRANLRLQRIYDSDKYKKIFPGTKINQSNAVTISGQTLRNREILEYVGHDGFFRNTTVRGSITGEGLDLGVIDDPIKGREEAGSEVIREKSWDWLTDDFLTRFSEHGGLLAIATRWHIDDPLGRMRLNFPQLKVLTYPALADEKCKLMPDDPRIPGSNDSLFPEHKSQEFIMLRKKAMAAPNFEALYQQNPVVLGGEIIKGGAFRRYIMLPKIVHRVIYADTAQKTKEANDYSVFQCWGLGEDKCAYLIDQIRGKWVAPDLRRNARDFWNKHKAVPNLGALRCMKIEDKASGTGLIQDFRREFKIPVKEIERVVDKLTRVMDVLPYIDSGYVFLPHEAEFVSEFISECEAFTANDSHMHDDQIDPMCDAITDLLASSAKGIMDVL
jgi:predicted phage terminase large subunit-like protein